MTSTNNVADRPLTGHLDSRSRVYPLSAKGAEVGDGPLPSCDIRLLLGRQPDGIANDAWLQNHVVRSRSEVKAVSEDHLPGT